MFDNSSRIVISLVPILWNNKLPLELTVTTEGLEDINLIFSFVVSIDV